MNSLMQYQTYHHSNAHAIQRKHFVRLQANVIHDENLTSDSEHILAENPTLNPTLKPPPECQTLILYFLNGYAAGYCLLLHDLPNH